MKLVSGLLSAALLSKATIIVPTLQPYWFLLKDNQRTWCGYSNEQKFQLQASEIKPLESARLTLIAGAPQEITYQVQPESGDWITADKYSFSPGYIKLERTTIFPQTEIQVLQESEIRAGKAKPLKTVSVTNLNGLFANVKGLDYPNIPIKTRISDFPFLRLAQAMSRKYISALCEKTSSH